MMNDIQAHQNSVDTLNDAGRQIIESERGSDNASKTQQKLNDLNKKWADLQQKANGRQKELEDALREAQAFNAEIQDLLMWLRLIYTYFHFFSVIHLTYVFVFVVAMLMVHSIPQNLLEDYQKLHKSNSTDSWKSSMNLKPIDRKLRLYSIKVKSISKNQPRGLLLIYNII